MFTSFQLRSRMKQRGVILTWQEEKCSVWGSRISPMQEKCHQFHMLFLEKRVLSASLKSKSCRLPLWIVYQDKQGEEGSTDDVQDTYLQIKGWHLSCIAVLIWSASYPRNTTRDVFIMADGFLSVQCKPERDCQLSLNILFVMHLYLLVQIRHKMATGFTMTIRRLSSHCIYLLDQTCKADLFFIKYSI